MKYNLKTLINNNLFKIIKKNFKLIVLIIIFMLILIKYSLYTSIYMVVLLILLIIIKIRDPGVIPKNDLEESFIPLLKTSENISFDFNLNGNNIKIKYCYTCKIYRPPRAVHCKICEKCIMKYDHHCMWINRCIGKRNLVYFLFFSIMLTIFSFISILKIYNYSKISEYKILSIKNILDIFITFSSWIFMFLFFIFSNILLITNFYLLKKNFTLKEFLKQKKKLSIYKNPFYINYWQNFFLIINESIKNRSIKNYHKFNKIINILKK